MEQNRDGQLEQIIAATDKLIVLAREAGSQSGMFLEMARLQLLLEYNEITEAEFGAFCDALEEGRFVQGRCEPVAAAHARPRRNGDLRLMRRAWREPQDRTSQRGRARAGR
ncbi:MAG: hypothetical protein WDO17_01075 [Alphaproteobacteria bacterium]